MRPQGTDELAMVNGAPIELRRDGVRPMHYLSGRPLMSGARVELLLANGSWLGGIYEWAGSEVRWPGLRIFLGGQLIPGGTRPSMVAPIHPNALLRWPPA